MANYAPNSRRPIAQMFRITAGAATRACVRLHISPDAISCFSVVAAVAAAICFWKSGRYPSLLLVAPLLCYLRLWFNMLDGMVAIAANKASLRGEIINDLPDRISDAVIFAGAAESGWMHPSLGYWSAVLALLTAYVGLFGQAIGCGRQFGGMMSKPWRMVVLGIGAWATFLFSSSMPHQSWLTLLDWSCLVVIAGCAESIFVRLKRILRSAQRSAT